MAEQNPILEAQVNAILDYARKDSGRRTYDEKSILLCPTELVVALRDTPTDLKKTVVKTPKYFSKNPICYTDEETGLPVRVVPDERLDRGLYVIDTMRAKKPATLIYAAKEWLFFAYYQHRITMIMDENAHSINGAVHAQDSKLSQIRLDIPFVMRVGGGADLATILKRHK